MSRPDFVPDEMGRRIKDILAHRKIQRMLLNPGLTRAAVLLPLFLKDHSPHILFIQRTEKVKHHKGEISFPGGAYHTADEDLQTTALRETHEEIGVTAGDVEVLGELDEVITLSNFVVSPFVGLIPYPYSFVPSREETREIIVLPLACFLQDGILTEQYMTYRNQTQIVYSYHCDRHVIWGATAKILRQFLGLISGASIT